MGFIPLDDLPHAVSAILNTAACLVVIWHCLCGLNRMSRDTRCSIKWAVRIIAVGALASLLHPPDPDLGGVGQMLTLGGLAVILLFTRRRNYCEACAARRLDNVLGGHEP